MRGVLLALLFGLACRDGRAPHAAASAPATGHVTDEELVAFTHWQRESAELSGRYLAALEALSGSDVPADQVQSQAAEVAARHAPLVQAHNDRVPLKGSKAELVTEALGGLFHFDRKVTGHELVVARDEVRLTAARRRFGAAAVDDILRREPLILAALRAP